MNEDKVRIEWIDISKGIGIILLVLGHCVVKTDYVHKFIFSFHIPLFYVLSGYCFNVVKYKNLMEVVVKRGKALLLPYCIFWLVGLTVTLLIPEWREALTFRGLVVDLYQGYPSSMHLTSTWYLVSLYLITSVFYIMYMIASKLKLKCILYIGVALSGFMGYMIYIVKSIMGVSSNADAASKTFLPGGRLPLTIDASMMALVFFAFGVWAYKVSLPSRLKFRNAGIIAGFLISFMISVFLNERVNIHGCSYGNVIYFFGAAFAGMLMVVNLSQMLENGKGAVIVKIKQMLLFYGRNSLYMLGMQSLFVHLYVYFLNKWQDTDYVLYESVPSVYGYIGFFVITFLCLPISFWGYGKLKRIGRANGKT